MIVDLTEQEVAFLKALFGNVPLGETFPKAKRDALVGLINIMDGIMVKLQPKPVEKDVKPA